MIIRNNKDGNVLFIGRVGWEYSSRTIEKTVDAYADEGVKSVGTLEEFLAEKCGIAHKDMETLEDDLEDYDKVI